MPKTESGQQLFGFEVPLWQLFFIGFFKKKKKKDENEQR